MGGKLGVQYAQLRMERCFGDSRMTVWLVKTLALRSVNRVRVL